MMAKFSPRRILGRWKEGYSLDLHTLSSLYIGDDELGHPQFDTTRSEVGELLYRLKNKGDQTAVSEIVDAVEKQMKSWKAASGHYSSGSAIE